VDWAASPPDRRRSLGVAPIQTAGTARTWISVWQRSFAIVNALIFGKVILIAQTLEFGTSLERRALIWIVLGKSLIFAILLVAFHIVEQAIRAWFKSQPLSVAFADLGGALSGS
jgi:hypothetical protein